MKLARFIGHHVRGAAAAAGKMPKLARMMVKDRKNLPSWCNDRINSEAPIIRGLPWISYPALQFLQDIVKPGMRVFEWGSGGSTIFFARLGCSITSVESSEFWHSQLEGGLQLLTKDQRSKVEIRFIRADPNEYPQGLDDYVTSVFDGSPWELVLVDGWERVRCAEAAQGALAPGGMLLFDNSDLNHFADVPERLSSLQGRPFPGLGVSRIWPTQTTIYQRRT